MVENVVIQEIPEGKLREKLADLCYEQWPGWMKYLFEFGVFNADGTVVIGATAARQQGGGEEE